jgi:hypothetical protein
MWGILVCPQPFFGNNFGPAIQLFFYVDLDVLPVFIQQNTINVFLGYSPSLGYILALTR